MVEYIPIVHWVYLYSRIQETETCKLVSAKKELKTSRLQIWQIWVTLNFHVPQPKPSLNAWHSNLDHHRTIPDISSHWPTFSSKECPVGRANWELHQALAIQLLLVESWIMTLKSCDYEPEKKTYKRLMWSCEEKRNNNRATAGTGQRSLPARRALLFVVHFCGTGALRKTEVIPLRCWIRRSTQLRITMIPKHKKASEAGRFSLPISHGQIVTHPTVTSQRIETSWHPKQEVAMFKNPFLLILETIRKKRSSSGYFTINLKMTWI